MRSTMAVGNPGCDKIVCGQGYTARLAVVLA